MPRAAARGLASASAASTSASWAAASAYSSALMLGVGDGVLEQPRRILAGGDGRLEGLDDGGRIHAGLLGSERWRP